ncbi:MAG: hypothetical protein PHR51_00005 [Patescibacteria group bacterium]|nr:hypothetical protein [Patescibacteria group bacterium]
MSPNRWAMWDRVWPGILVLVTMVTAWRYMALFTDLKEAHSSHPIVNGDNWVSIAPDSIVFSSGGDVESVTLPIPRAPDVRIDTDEVLSSEIGCLEAGVPVGWYWHRLGDGAEPRVWQVVPSYPQTGGILSDDNGKSMVHETVVRASNKIWKVIPSHPEIGRPADLYCQWRWQVTNGVCPTDGKWVVTAPWVVIDQSFNST